MFFMATKRSNKWLALIRQLRKKDIEWMACHYCEHGHPYLSHLRCFIRDRDAGNLPTDNIELQEEVGFFDIEASNLKADFGYMFSYAIKEKDGKILGRVLTPKEIRNFTFDRMLIEEMIKDLEKFDRIVVHYGTDRKFDIPFVRARALKWGYEFPLYRSIWTHDTWHMSRRKLCLASNRLENICRFFDIPAKEHKLVPNAWQKALSGDKDSLAWIWEHNKEDVVSLEEVWKKLNLYVPKGKTSI